jgi:hypothetical protein
MNWKGLRSALRMIRDRDRIKQVFAIVLLINKVRIR